MVARCHSVSLVVPLVVIPCHSLSLFVIRCHSLSFVVTRCTTRCHSLHHSLVIRCHSLSFVVMHCHSLSLHVPLVCLFINDRLFCLQMMLKIGNKHGWVICDTCFKLSLGTQKPCHIFSLWTTFNNPCDVLIANF